MPIYVSQSLDVNPAFPLRCNPAFMEEESCIDHSAFGAFLKGVASRKRLQFAIENR